MAFTSRRDTPGGESSGKVAQTVWYRVCWYDNAMKNTIAKLALVGLLATVGSACIVRARGHVGGPVVVVEEEPPPPRTVVVTTRPGYIWIDGRWDRQGSRWVWVNGYYERERAGYVWAPGRWERRGRGHVYVQGSWRAGGSGGSYNNNNGRGNAYGNSSGPAVRDHRGNGRGNNGNGRGNGGPNVRDHRR